MGIRPPLTRLSVIIESSPDISFDISSYSIGFTHEPPEGGGGGGGASKVEPTDLTVQKNLDTASIPLFGAVTSGTSFPFLTLTVHQNSNLLFTITLKNVTVTEFEQSGSASGVVEVVKFNWEIITMETDAFGEDQSESYNKTTGV